MTAEQSRGLASRLRELRQDLATVDPSELPEAARRELARLVKAGQALLPAGV